MIRTSLVVAALLGWTSVAASQAEPEPTTPPADAPVEPSPPDVAPVVVAPIPPPIVEETRAKKKITVLFAPLRLIIPLVEFTAEYRVADKLGVSITLGAGSERSNRAAVRRRAPSSRMERRFATT